jgi:hypothetical protein
MGLTNSVLFRKQELVAMYKKSPSHAALMYKGMVQ